MNNWEKFKSRDITKEAYERCSDRMLEEIENHLQSNVSFKYSWYDFKYKMGCFNPNELFLEYTKNIGGKEKFIKSVEVYFTLLEFKKFTYFKYHSESENKYYNNTLSLNTSTIIDQINFYLDRLNYKVKVLYDYQVIVIQADDVVEEVAYKFYRHEDLNFSWRLLSYRSISTSIELKKDILREFYMKIEKFGESEGHANLKTDASYKRAKHFLNYFRHAKKQINQEIEDNIEEFCDVTFDLALEFMLHFENDKGYKKYKDMITSK